MLFLLWDWVAGLDGAEGHALCGGCGGGFAAVGFADSAAGGVGFAPRKLLRHCDCALLVGREVCEVGGEVLLRDCAMSFAGPW